MERPFNSATPRGPTSGTTSSGAWTPIYLSGVERCQLVGNRLVSQTLDGGNSEAYILSARSGSASASSRTTCAPVRRAPRPAARPADASSSFSTGRGSVDLNWIAGNREDKARFGDVAGEPRSQNAGETILFEAGERIAYYGPLAAAGRQSVTLPATASADARRSPGHAPPPAACPRRGGQRNPVLAAGRGPGTRGPPGAEPPVGEYFATILRGRGLGQTRRVVGRKGETYLLDRPWRVAPQAGGLVLVHTAFWRNH